MDVSCHRHFFLVLLLNQQCTNMRSDTTLPQPNRTNTPVHTKTEQYTHIQSSAPEDECNNIRNMLSNKNFHKVTSSWFNLLSQCFGLWFEVLVFNTRLSAFCHTVQLLRCAVLLAKLMCLLLVTHYCSVLRAFFHSRKKM